MGANKDLPQQRLGSGWGRNRYSRFAGAGGANGYHLTYPTKNRSTTSIWEYMWYARLRESQERRPVNPAINSVAVRPYLRAALP